MVKTKLAKQPRIPKNGTEPLKIKLDLSHGVLPPNHPFTRIGNLNPAKFPWPIKDGSVEEAFSAFLFQRIPADQRGNFMDELWRVLVPQGKATIIVPYWTSPRAIQDSTHQWPPFCEQSFFYYNKQWRDAQGPNEQGRFKCDFDIVYGHALEQETVNRNDETRPFWVKHYVNAVNDLHVTLTKR